MPKPHVSGVRHMLLRHLHLPGHPLTSLAHFLRHNGRLVAFGFLMCFWSSFGQTFFISLFNGELRAAFNLSHGDIGSMYAAGTIASAATLMFAGRLVDRFSLAKVTAFVLAGLALAAAAMSLVWAAAALPFVFYALRLFGQGLSAHTGMTAMGRYFDAARGRAISLATLGYSAGEAVLPGIVVAGLAIVHWRTLWAATAVCAIVAIAVSVLLLRGAAAHEEGRATTSGKALPARQYRLGEVLSEPSLWLRLPLLLTPPFVVTGLFFHQVHLAAGKGWPMALMAGSFTLFAAASFISVLFAGPLVDRITARRLLPWALIPLTLACLMLAMTDARIAAPGFMILIGIGTGLCTIASNAIWPERYGVRHLGAIKAFAQSSMVLASGLSPVVFGLLIDRGLPFAAITVGSAAFCVVASGLAALANRLDAPIRDSAASVP